ncbi:hypothetical protein MYK68_13940 [Gordonia sp. PP30]|uniref:phage holin n=1 Tax=Gordonia sp. PP30 TaxID=2935861 RepID=UPI001FFE5396|nr:hypothetical protein [Gordonia sp. PP30]UQE73831.1 hypothetical protein MYK68_13940 [Gordonia sp. PP30]
MTPAVRQRIYLVLTAALPILVAYGVLADTEVAMWLALGSAVLGTGGFAMAAVNTPSARHHGDEPE